MANLSGKGGMTQRKLIAVWKDSNQTTLEGNREGRVTGAYIDIQLDQSDLTPEDIAAGKGQANPHLNNQLETYNDKATGEEKKAMNHRTWYSARQIASMTGKLQGARGDDIAFSKTEDGRNVVSFTADVISRKYTDNDGKSRTRFLVACPKDLDNVKPEDMAKAQAFNEKHAITPHPGFNADELLGKQDAVTAAAKDQRKAQYEATQEMQADKSVEAEAEADNGFVELLPDDLDLASALG